MATHAAHHDDHHDEKPHGFFNRWVYTTNHKDIGTLYLVFSLLMFFIGGSMAMVIRAELCGKDHGFMPIVVKAVSKAEFAQWLAAEKAKNAPPAAAPAPVATPAPESAEAATHAEATPAPAEPQVAAPAAQEPVPAGG